MDLKTLKDWPAKKEFLKVKGTDARPTNGRLLLEKVYADKHLLNQDIAMPDKTLVDTKGTVLSSTVELDTDKIEGYGRYIVIDMAPDVEVLFANQQREYMNTFPGQKIRTLQRGDTVLLSKDMIFIGMIRQNMGFLIIHHMDIIDFVPFEEDKILQHFADKV